MASNNTSPPSRPPLPTLDEIHRAIPPNGIKISDFTELFRARMPAEESIRTLFLLANAVARFDYKHSMMWPKPRPSKEEVRATLKQNGIRFEEFVGLFGWNDMMEEKRARIACCLDRIAVPDMATGTIRPRGNVTAEAMIAAIPDEGIAGFELERKINEFINPATPAEFWEAFKILTQVAVWDVYTEKIFRRNATA
jgi:hypothetical protein